MHTGVFTRYDEAVVLDEYAFSRPEGDQAVQARVQFGYEKDLECKPFALALGITKVMRDAGFAHWADEAKVQHDDLSRINASLKDATVKKLK